MNALQKTIFQLVRIDFEIHFSLIMPSNVFSMEQIQPSDSLSGFGCQFRLFWVGKAKSDVGG